MQLEEERLPGAGVASAAAGLALAAQPHLAQQRALLRLLLDLRQYVGSADKARRRNGRTLQVEKANEELERLADEELAVQPPERTHLPRIIWSVAARARRRTKVSSEQSNHYQSDNCNSQRELKDTSAMGLEEKKPTQ